MLKNMKKTRFLTYIVFFLCLGNYLSAKPIKKQSQAIQRYDLITCTKELNFEKNLSLGKLYIIPAIMGAIIAYNQQEFVKNIQQNPILSIIGFCVIANFLLDATIKYKQINRTLNLFYLSKTISRYMLYAIAIKNTMLQIAKKDTCCTFQEEEFFKTVTNQIPLSFHELEQFVFELLHSCIKTIHTMHMQIHTDVEEKLYLLCKEHITLEEVLSLYDEDEDFYPHLQKLLQNPDEYYKSAAFTLNTLIKKHLQYMIKHQPETE